MEKLAIDGGTPVRTREPIVETDVFDKEELDALMEVARNKKLRRAEAAIEYERVLAEWFGVKHAIAVSSGTTALHIALAAFGIGPGDEVIVSPYTFVASDTAVLEQNAIPIFADIDPITLTLDPNDIARRITPRTKAIIPVTISGTAGGYGSDHGVGAQTQLVGFRGCLPIAWSHLQRQAGRDDRACGGVQHYHRKDHQHRRGRFRDHQ